ncbi:MAG: 2-hydroxyacyl-CoA dehydratase [Deltaproteobacteria bacterium]|nr:2-hydroxyacyl-CoA dehydratase [Deltaproteobacteria bacterium]
MIKRIKYIINVEVLGKLLLLIRSKLEKLRLKTKGKLKKSNIFGPPIISSAEMKNLMSQHYLKGMYTTKKVAWVTSGAPIEFLLALDYYLFYPENHAALCGARKLSTELIEDSEEGLYPQDICSYAKVNLGWILKNKDPISKLPKPDLILACTNICQTVLYWYQVLADIYKIPLIVIDTPFVYDTINNDQLMYVKRQLNDSIPIMEKVSGKGLSEKRLREVLSYSREAVALWLKILMTAKHRPSPISAFDTFIHMGPIVNLRGERRTVLYYQRLLSELEYRVKNNIGAIRNEEIRLLWDNLPIWFMLREISTFLAKMNTNIIAATFSYAWGELAHLIDENRPLDSISSIYSQVLLNRSPLSKFEVLKKLTKELEVDGIILHSNRSCKPYSLGQIDQRNCIVSELSLPAFLIEADQADSRDFNFNQANMRLEAFIEEIKERKWRSKAQ